MNQNLLRIYISNLSLEDIKKIALKHNITLDDDEVLRVFNYIKDNSDKYFSGDLDIDTIISETSILLNKSNYNTLLDIYLKYKENK